MRPRIIQSDGQIGFYWVDPDGAAARLPELVVGDEEPHRLVATHLEALDDALIIAAGRFGEILGGGRTPEAAERDDLVVLHRVIDLLISDYARAAGAVGVTPDVRAGQIVGTAALFSIRARQPVGLLGPAPFAGELDEPPLGVVSGYGEMVQVDPAQPWRGGRWILRAENGQRYPLTLTTMLFDSSGVNKDATRREHREVLRACISGASNPEADPFAVACALDWLLYDWLMAHREDEDSAAIVIPRGQESDAAMIVDAAAASVAARARFDPGLIPVP
ncbi:Uncharacterised protein [Mycolicibacterium phlei]|uniref:Uncharacterized protein n=1 Tax=Mycolicibacterium phlei DSM 43239 = CCUG 21000 TaxID=1226750 RepID=A0A5N5UTZ4_MYCPH|nr:hypothetical protein [Mycolicibacterium phlei]VEG11012.1 Uncharacterised protein [Mycobacteroides chelonae]AMO62912.1 hypothetical protein MPHLCCUG_04124 [Mycolicibacterium phlei]KAB7751979.1 hypothetical protein MPHL21000_22620 [Mycolicibacterium phlei DSM 43239 = CCUG 21000]KXW59564.1 hypothetical protein MPHL43072_13115 [Mycolicibacterium phlei DSM 43072]KXW60576.1 hypothetical protein MPHL43239_24345 [Mycolicibacterium phlei DSM 43239 = CCUG 21000]